MYPVRPVLVRLAVLLLALLVVTGCAQAEEHVLTVRDWTFVGPDGRTADLHLPARVDGMLPHEDCAYHLRAHVELPPALRGRPLTLAFPFLHAHGELRADGVDLVALDPAM